MCECDALQLEAPGLRTSRSLL